MKKPLFVLIASFGFALPADALALKAITSKPTADNPQYDNKKAWPDLVGDEYFTKQKWPKARLLIWAHPDGAKGKRGPKLDPMVPANWIDAATGKPAKTLFDMNTDVILPDSEKAYKVSVSGKPVNIACRHLTVGKNAQFFPGAGGALSVFGNLWIRPDATLHIYRTLKLVGQSDTFLRRDWPADGVLKKMHDEGAIVRWEPGTYKSPWGVGGKHGNISYFAKHDKPEGSTEMIGFIKTVDEFTIQSGTLIVGRDSRFQISWNGYRHIRNGATLALMDGAMTAQESNSHGITMQADSSLTGGLPDRPLKRDARAGFAYSNWMHIPYTGYRGGATRFVQSGWDGKSVDLRGKVIGYPAKGSDARLVIGWQRTELPMGGRHLKDELWSKPYSKIVPKITVWVCDGTQIENVKFEDVHRGGIWLTDPEAFKKWKNVSFGDGCLSRDPAEILRKYTGKLRNGTPTEKMPEVKKYITIP